MKNSFMEAATLRKKLHILIDTSSDDKLEEIYNSFQEDEYSEEFKAILDNEYEQYQKDGEVISKEEIDKRIEQLLYSKK